MKTTTIIYIFYLLKIGSKRLTASILFLLYIVSASSQSVQDTFSCNRQCHRIAFYNLENLFDTFNDSLKNDEEFQPRGMRGWTQKKFYEKLGNMSKAIMALGGWQSLAILGVCEVENEYVLKKLISDTPLKIHKYRFIHYESGDPRGVDCALIYDPVKFRPLFSKPIPMYKSADFVSRSRDILYVKGLLSMKDTLHIFVNHWSSRYGGLLETQDKRNQAAALVKSITDSLMKVDSVASIVIMGDLNDDPFDESLINHLKAAQPDQLSDDYTLYNLMLPLCNDWTRGSLKHGTQWSIFDQIIVSRPMISPKAKLRIAGKAVIFRQDFLLEPDPGDLGVQPFRTFTGFKYHGGFSDHLPVFIDVKVNY